MGYSADAHHLVPIKPSFRKVSEWLDILQSNPRNSLLKLDDIYGDDQTLINGRKLMFTKALERFGSLHGADREVVITRAPARINLRGMHSEMQHATPNYLTHGREVITVAGKRDDDIVVLNNVESERFGTRQFRISDEISRGKWGDWIEYIDSHGVRSSVESTRGDWANYVKASVLKIQDDFPDIKLKGMDAVIYGDVPRGSGMASSSALVVSAGLSAMAVNDLAMDRREMVVCMGRGEWYVGTRGGLGDHGAMLFGKYGHILHSVFLNIDEIQPEYIPFPQEYQVVIINSYKSSTKSAERLFAYNQTMFAYSMAMILIKDVLKSMGEYSADFLDQITYLGQITPKTFELEKIYKILKALPERVTVSALKERYPPSEIEKRLDRYFGQLGRYPEFVEVRGAALWGIAESERSREFAQLIKAGKIGSAGELMCIGHNGDRLFSLNGDRKYAEFTENRVTDNYLHSLIADLQSGDRKNVQRAMLSRQPGDFDASSIELDSIVDIACGTDGILGASLTGAGFGGNILAIGRKDENALIALKKALLNDYYEPYELAELEWIQRDRELESQLKDDGIEQIRHKLKDIVERKQRAKTRMDQADTEYAQSLQGKINKLFKEKKIKRELSFIPADYYSEGVVVNVPVERAEVF